MNKSVIIIGAGGHSKVIVDIVCKSNDTVLGFIDDNKTENEMPFGLPKLGEINSIPQIKAKYPNSLFFIAIGTNELRKKIVEKFDLSYYTAIHPNSTIGIDVKIGEGTCLMCNTVINSSTVIGYHCIINTGAIIEHDNIISNYVHISPNATLGGTINVGELTHIGLGSIVKNGVKIGSNITIGAGAVVVNDIFESGIYVGIPAKRKYK